MYCWRNLAKLTIIVLMLFSVSCHEFEFRRNLAAVKVNFRNIRSAQITLKQSKGKYGDLKELCEAGYLSKDLIDGHHMGYSYKVIVSNNSYVATAVPEKYSKDFNSSTGNISLYLDETGIIRGALNEGKEASSNDNPLLDED